MTELAGPLAAAVVGVPLLGGVAIQFARTPSKADRVNLAAAVATALTALLLAAIALGRGGAAALHGRLFIVDGASGVYLALIAVIGLCSALVSPAYLRTSGRGWFSAAHSRRWYYGALYAFWAAMLAVPLTANLAVAWLVIEATTAASAILIAFTGKRDALEAGWKYLVLTTLGLSVALLGIVVLSIAAEHAGASGLHALDWRTLDRIAPELDGGTALVAFVLLIAGLAAKIGWAPVHNWLPDAHSEAPAPISAMLSAALLPTVLLVAWRAKVTLGAAAGESAAGSLFIGFGLASLLVAVPFLWRSLPWKRLLAYSSLEHMGVIALGIGFGTPLAIAGVVVHVAGHGLAKALGFYAALPLLRVDPDASHRPPEGVSATSPRTAMAMGVSLAALGALPPSPVFVSELLILLGGVAAGEIAVVVVAAVALALGFLGLLHAFFLGVVGDRVHGRRARHRTERPIVVLAVVLGAAMLGLSAVAVLLPGSDFVATLARGAL